MHTSSPRILFFSRKYPPSVGGMEQYSYHLTKTIRCNKKIIAWGGSQRWLFLVLPYFILRALLGAWRYDLVHLGDPVLSCVGFVVKKLYRKPVVVNVHGLDITHPVPLYQWYLKTFGKKFDQYICISKHTLVEAESRGYAPCIFLPVGVTAPKTPSSREEGRDFLSKRLHKNLTGTPILLTVGRLVKRKGVAWFIREVMPLLPPATLSIVVGAGKEESAIQKAITETSLTERVILLGKLSEEDLERVYRGSDLFIMPNIAVPGDIEGFGIVALEAAVRRLPVIASRLEGIQDALQDGKGGILLPPGNAQAFADTIRDVLANRTKSNAVSEKAATWTWATYNWETVAAQYHEAFIHTLENHAHHS